MLYYTYISNISFLKIQIESVQERKKCDLCGHEFTSNIKDTNYCDECFEKDDKIQALKTTHNVEYSPKFFERDHSPVFLSKPKKDTVGRNSVSPIDYEISGSNDKDKSSESNTKERNNCVECIEKNEKVRALEIEYVHARNRLDTEFEQKKQKLVEREVASMKSLEESNTKYR